MDRIAPDHRDDGPLASWADRECGGDAPAVVSGSELSRRTGFSGSGYRILTPGVGPDDGAVAGTYLLSELRPGLMVHATDTVELHDLTTEIVQEPGLTCYLLLEGEVDFQLGGHHFSLAPANGPRPGAQGQLILQREPETFIRRSRRGTHIRKVCVTVSLDWLRVEAAEVLPLLDPVANTCLSHAVWKPSPHTVALAEQILHPPGIGGFVDRLHLECRATAILLEALRSLTELGHETPPAIRPQDRRRVQAACDRLESSASPVPLAVLAREVGASVSTLQRLFQAVYGTSVHGYLRERRLLKARFALEIGEASIAEAAALAGYSSPANFATAFKRRFGLSPSELQASG